MTSTQRELGLYLGLPQDAVDANGRVWFRDLDGNGAVFVDQDPFYCYPLDDPVLHRFCAIRLVEAGLVKVCEICRVFEMHDRSFSRYRSCFRKQGMASSVPRKVGCKPPETASIARRIVQAQQPPLPVAVDEPDVLADRQRWMWKRPKRRQLKAYLPTPKRSNLMGSVSDSRDAKWSNPSLVNRSWSKPRVSLLLRRWRKANSRRSL